MFLSSTHLVTGRNCRHDKLDFLSTAEAFFVKLSSSSILSDNVSEIRLNFDANYCLKFAFGQNGLNGLNLLRSFLATSKLFEAFFN